MTFAEGGLQGFEDFLRAWIRAPAHDLVPLFDFLVSQVTRIKQIGL